MSNRAHGLVNFSQKAIIAIHTMVYLEEVGEGVVVDSGTMAYDLGVSHSHLAKVLSLLAKKGLIKSLRGRGGGITMVLPNDRLSLLDILDAVDEPFEGPYCLLNKPVDKHNQCALVDFMDRVNAMLMDALAGITMDNFKPCPHVRPGREKRQK